MSELHEKNHRPKSGREGGTTMISYKNLSAGICLGGIVGTLYLFTSGYIQAGYWMSGLVVGLSTEAMYDFIREIATKEVKK